MKAGGNICELLLLSVDLSGPPSQPKVENITNNSVSLSWNKPRDDGGALDKYVVEMKTPKGDWVEAAEVPARYVHTHIIYTCCVYACII